MRKLVQFLLGSIQISVTGAFPERFLNLCGIENLPFHHSKQINRNQIAITIPLYCWRKAQRLAERASCQITREQGEGFPFFLYRFRSRYALIAGLLFAIFCSSMLSQFILVITVSGNQQIADSVILTKLEELGFGVGSYGPSVDRRTLANDALLALPELSFLSVNITGVRAEIVVRETKQPPKLENRWAAADIVAATDGMIVDVNAWMGAPQVQAGQAVLQGEVLISGLESYERGDGSGVVLSSSQVHAEGEVWAYTARTLRAATPLKLTQRGAVEQSQTRYALRLLKYFTKFYQGSSIFPSACDKMVFEYALALPKVGTLPLVWQRIITTQYQTNIAASSRDREQTRLSAQLQQALKNLMGEYGTVLTQKQHFDVQSDVLTATLEASCLEQIGQTIELSTE